MKKKKDNIESPPKVPVSKAWTEEGRRNQITAEAYDLVEQRILAGTASAQETVFFLRLGAAQTKLEEEKLRAEVKLAEAKIEALKSSEENARLYAEAMAAMRTYSGLEEEAND